MRSSCGLMLTLLSLFTLNLFGQQLSQTDEQILNAARSRYYNLPAKGFGSATCQVEFDFTTIPAALLKKNASVIPILKATKFTIHLSTNRPLDVRYAYPGWASQSSQHEADSLAKWLRSLVMGVFQTWPSKGLVGPIPPFDSEIVGIVKNASGFRFILNIPGGPAHLVMNKDFLVTEIVSANGQIDEQPVYIPNKAGLVYAGTTTTVKEHQDSDLRVAYELRSSSIDGILFPTSVHLRVVANMDVTYALNQCSITKGKGIQVKPPAN